MPMLRQLLVAEVVSTMRTLLFPPHDYRAAGIAQRLIRGRTISARRYRVSRWVRASAFPRNTGVSRVVHRRPATNMALVVGPV